MSSSHSLFLSNSRYAGYSDRTLYTDLLVVHTERHVTGLELDRSGSRSKFELPGARTDTIWSWNPEPSNKVLNARARTGSSNLRCYSLQGLNRRPSGWSHVKQNQVPAASNRIQ
jgi:hypothetical protein